MKPGRRATFFWGVRSGDWPIDFLSGAPPSVGAERTENSEKSPRPFRQSEMAFPRLVNRILAVVILSFRLE